MISALLLSFAALQPSLPSAPLNQGPARNKRQAAFEQLLRRGSGSQGLSLGGNFTTAAGGAQLRAQRTLVPGVYQIQLNDPGTGWQESVLLGIPAVKESPTPPLLVMFHGADISEWDCYVNTPLFQDALDRGWYVIAPLGAHQVNFGIPYSQINIEYALDIFTNLLPTDPERVYGIGFSMGGGTMMSYAARHLDPAHPRFAAVVNHTGGVSVANTYWSVSNTSILDNPLMFGGSPNDFPFLYSEASVVDIDFQTSAVDPQTDQARNLAHIPVLNEYAESDPLAYLRNQTQVVYDWLSLIPGMQTWLLTPNQQVHAWTTIDANTALNFLLSKTLVVPKQGEHRLLADREATWHHFYVYQDAPGAFTPLRWVMDSGANRLTLDETANLAHVVVSTLSIGLNTAVNMDIELGTADGTAELVTLTGYALQPQSVLRNGIPSASWSWDPVAKSVTLTESDASGHPVWRIRP
jgi:pimeloyl-ACP methyl ester carboxylesterase